jgi:hypothetical protein
MTRVSVIGSVHNDRGLANASSLLAILEHLQPEVVFLEEPEAGFEGFCSGTRSSLESRAVCRYRQLHQTTLVPVDRTTPPLALRSRVDALYDAIEGQSSDYLRLVGARDHHTTTFGFHFLNSPNFLKLCSDIQAAELSAIQALGSDELTAFYRMWRDTNELREEGMMNNIEVYCRNNALERGVFLVGSAHRMSVYDKSRERSDAGSPIIHWVFPGLGGSDEDGHGPLPV